jgi:hypothetical protein
MEPEGSLPCSQESASQNGDELWDGMAEEDRDR